MIKPKPLTPGARLAVLGGSSPTDVTPDKLAAAVREMGLEPVIYPTASARHGYLSGTDAMRAADINAAFADDTIDGIMTTRGGYGSPRILPLLDWKTIHKHPKFFGGYSDVTSFLTCLNQLGGFEAYHMPMVGAWSGVLDPYSLSFAKAMLFDEPIEYANPADAPAMQTLAGGKAKGRLCGGNLSLVASSMGTPFELDTKGKILFLEDVGEAPYRIDGMLTQLRNCGKFDDAAGIVLGAFTNCEEKEPKSGLTLQNIFAEVVVPAHKPTISGVVCGHCSPTMSLPMGRMFRLDADSCELKSL